MYKGKKCGGPLRVQMRIFFVCVPGSKLTLCSKIDTYKDEIHNGFSFKLVFRALYEV